MRGDGGGKTTSFSDYVSKSLTDKSILQEKTKKNARRVRARRERDKNKMFIWYENLTAILSDFLSVFESKQTTTHQKINGFFAQADIEKGKRKRFLFYSVELFFFLYARPFATEVFDDFVWMERSNVWNVEQLKPMSWHKICHMSILIWRVKYVRKFKMYLIGRRSVQTARNEWLILICGRTHLSVPTNHLNNLIGYFDKFTN